MSLAPDTLQPNSMLPNISSFTKFPATLATKRSPIPLSNTSSTGTRLSTHERITALGYCPTDAFRTIAEWSLAVMLLFTKRLFPSLRLSITISGVNACCSAAVSTFSLNGFCICDGVIESSADMVLFLFSDES